MDHATLSFLRGLAPELTGQMYLRALALTRIASIAPVGRRLLSQQMDLPEREVRSLCDGMREDGLISCSAGGMTLTEKGGALLSEAQETVRYLGGIDELESRLKARLDVDCVCVQPGNADQNPQLLREVGRLAAHRLRSLLTDGMILTVSGGSSVAAVAEGMRGLPPVKVHVIPARGGVGRAAETQASTLAEKFARALGGSYSALHLPDSISPAALRELVKLPEIREPLGAMHHTDLLLYGIGRADIMSRNRALPEEEVRGILRMGAAAEAVGCYFDEKGKMLFQASGVSLHEEQLRTIPLIAAVAAGPGKARAILAVLRHHRHHLLVIDEGAAREIERILSEEPKQ